MRWLGIDHGDSRIGLSISDELASFAHPYRTLQRDAQVFDEIRQIVERERIGAIVIGLPKNMDGTLGQSAAKAKAFGDRTCPGHSSDQYHFLGRTTDYCRSPTRPARCRQKC